jgi:urea transport system permease protein
MRRGGWGKGALLVGWIFLLAGAVRAEGDVAALIKDLGSEDVNVVAKAATALGEQNLGQGLPALEALYDDRLKVAADGVVLIEDAKTHAYRDAVTGTDVASPKTPLRSGEMDNQLRRVVTPVIAQLQLVSPDKSVRLTAAQELISRGDESAVPTLRRVLEAEKDAGVREALTLGLARLDLRSQSPETRLAALNVLKRAGASVKGDLEGVLKKKPDGSFSEPDERVRKAATEALSAIQGRERLTAMVGNVVYGVSLASVLLFGALGLAITFGVMGVINMAHGEMLTLGAYSAFVVQRFCQQHAPGLLPYYVLLALPVAFVVSGGVGIVLERTILRWLYGRPLETLLATWGISLCLIQTIRLIFGANNVAVANPSWLQGGVEIASGLVVPYNRIGVVVFVIVAALLVALLVQRTSLGLQVRAITQNRNMASCMGVRSARVDMWTFGLGSAIAGLGGVALSQIGNVGPELGQTYILDAFMVVVLGGVGRIAGTVGAALGLGIIQKFLEPVAGAVLGKIAVLAFIILFIQRRPQGIFPVKGRVEA